MKKLLYVLGSVITFLVLYYTAATLISLAFIAYYVSQGFSKSGTLLFHTLLNNQSYNIVILAFLLLTAFYILFYKLRKRKVSDLIQVQRVSRASILLSIVAGISFYLILRFYLSFFIGNEKSFYINISHIYYSKGLAKDILIYIATALIILPILEEITHRGILFSILNRRLSLRLALIIQGIVFALIYTQPYVIVYTFILGVIAGILYNWYKSILLPIVFHLSFNAAALIVNTVSISKLFDTYDSAIFISNSIILPLILLCLYRLSIKAKHKLHIIKPQGQA